MKLSIRRFAALIALSFTLALATPNIASAQCPMCRMSAESNLDNGGEAGIGLNKGILYMLATPYLLVGVIGFIWWRNRRKEEEEEMV